MTSNNKNCEQFVKPLRPVFFKSIRTFLFPFSHLEKNNVTIDRYYISSHRLNIQGMVSLNQRPTETFCFSSLKLEGFNSEYDALRVYLRARLTARYGG
jgi:hypothetical protein